MKKLLFVAILSSLICLPALAGRAIDRTVRADPDGVVSIELISGSVRVAGWDRAEVQVTGSVGDDVEAVEVSADDGQVTIEVELVDDDGDGDRSYDDADADLEIRVPVRSELEAETISAGIVVTDLSGSIEVESVSGNVEIEGAPQEADVATISGKIDLTTEQPLEEGEIESISGNIKVRGALSPRCDLSIESISGNVELLLPADTSANFDIETFSGRIRNDLAPRSERSRHGGKATSLEFTMGGGDADVQIESFSGTIELRID